MNLNIITTDTGYFKPGLRGHIVGGSEREVWLGPPGHETKHTIPEFEIVLDGGGRMPFCQYGRDFRFADMI